MPNNSYQYYAYRGKHKVHAKPKPSHKNHLCEYGTFIIYGSRFTNGMKTQGNSLFWTLHNNQVLEYQLDCINYVCKHPEIIIIGGFEFDKLAKHSRRPEFKIIENILFELSNTALDLRYGLNIATYNNVFIMDGTFIPNIDVFGAILDSPNQSQLLVEQDNVNNNIAVHMNSNNLVTSFSYLGGNELSGFKYLAPLDTPRIKKIVINPYFIRTKFDFELLDTIKMRGVLNTFNTQTIKKK